MIYNDEDFEVTMHNELFEEIKIFYFNRLFEFTVPRYYNETDIEYKNRLVYFNQSIFIVCYYNLILFLRYNNIKK